jgi:hypothetical protein
MRIFYFFEKPNGNAHWHGLVRFFSVENRPRSLQERLFNYNAERIWLKLVPPGTVDVQPITGSKGVAR